MRFAASLLLALASLGACTSEAADAYIFRRHPQSNGQGPRLPKEVARHILLQRVSRNKQGDAIHDLPDAIDEATAISYVNTYGVAPAPLFQDAAAGPAQLVVLVNGVTTENSKALREAISHVKEHDAFHVANPPATRATTYLMEEFRTAGVTNDKECDFASAVNPFDHVCWDGASAVVWYDAEKTPSILSTITTNLARLTKFVANGDLEATLLLLPESSASSPKSWHSTSLRAAAELSELRRRSNMEQVLSQDKSTSAHETHAKATHTAKPTSTAKPKIPDCFSTANSCMSQTNSCSKHGECVNKYGNDSKTACFVCRCHQTEEKNEFGELYPTSIVQWGGAMCQKEDISVPFWLITGFTIAIIGVVGASIGMLFSMGQEPLPGVIGAGVSRSK